MPRMTARFYAGFYVGRAYMRPRLYDAALRRFMTRARQVYHLPTTSFLATGRRVYADAATAEAGRARTRRPPPRHSARTSAHASESARICFRALRLESMMPCRVY